MLIGPVLLFLLPGLVLLTLPNLLIILFYILQILRFMSASFPERNALLTLVTTLAAPVHESSAQSKLTYGGFLPCSFSGR